MISLLYKKHFNVDTKICRFYNVYGPHQLTEGEYCTVIGIFERQMLDKGELTITGDGEQRRDFTHVDDIVDGLMRCSEHFNFRGEEFEFGRGENFSINVIAQSFDWDYTYIPKRPGEMRKTLCTDTKAKEMLGWEPKRDILDYIEERRMEKAIQLIREDKDAIKVISNDVGFKDTAYFCRRFKLMFGVQAGKMRKRLNEI